MILVAPLIELIIVYWGADCLPGIEPFLSTYLILLLLALSAAGLGLFVGSISGSANESTALATALTLPILAFSGVIKSLATLPAWYGWFQYVSPTRFALNGVLVA